MELLGYYVQVLSGKVGSGKGGGATATLSFLNTHTRVRFVWPWGLIVELTMDHMVCFVYAVDSPTANLDREGVGDEPASS